MRICDAILPDNWSSSGELSFDEVKKEHPELKKGDWVLEKRVSYLTRSWEVYKPEGNHYRVYEVAMSNDPKSFFYSDRTEKKYEIINPKDNRFTAFWQEMIGHLKQGC